MNAVTVIASVSTATGLTVLANLLDGENSFSPVIGGFVVGTLLLMFSFVSAEIAAALALLALLTSVLMNADRILKHVESR